MMFEIAIGAVPMWVAIARGADGEMRTLLLEARTRSEARASAKSRLGIPRAGRLDRGTFVRKVT